MKKVLILCLALVLAIGSAVTGTIAYLQDTAEAVNVAVVGNVDIEQHEYQRKEGVAFNAALKEGDLVPYVQGQKLYPAYPVANAVKPYTADETDLLVWGPYVTADSDESKGTAAANGLWNEDKLKGAMDKMVFVENTGTADCYYRTWFAFECPKDMAYSTGSDKEFMMNVNLNKRFTWEEYKGEGAEDGYVEIDGVRYLVYCATYNQALEPGTISRPSLMQVVMTHNATNEDVKLLGDTYEILTFSQAVQTVNFVEAGLTPAQALEVAFGAEHPWKDGVNYPQWSEEAETPVANEDGVYTISTAEELAGFAKMVNEDKINFSGKTVKLTADIDLIGKTWTPIGQTGNCEFKGTFDGDGHTISHLTVDSSAQTGANYSSGLFGWIENHAAAGITIKNVTIDGAKITGHHNCGALVGYMTGSDSTAGAVLENCHVKNATVVCTKANNDADGDKAGALVGMATADKGVLKNCSATNCKVSAGRDAGQLVGAGKEVNVTGCTAKNVTVEANDTSTGANIRNELVGRAL